MAKNILKEEKSKRASSINLRSWKNHLQLNQ